VEAVKKGAPFGPVKVKRGKESKIAVVASEEGWVTVPKGKENQISVTPELPNVVAAPIQKNQILAKALIQNEGKVLREVNLISPVEVQKSFLPPGRNCCHRVRSSSRLTDWLLADPDEKNKTKTPQVKIDSE